MTFGMRIMLYRLGHLFRDHYFFILCLTYLSSSLGSNRWRLGSLRSSLTFGGGGGGGCSRRGSLFRSPDNKPREVCVLGREHEHASPLCSVVVGGDNIRCHQPRCSRSQAASRHGFPCVCVLNKLCCGGVPCK